VAHNHDSQDVIYISLYIKKIPLFPKVSPRTAIFPSNILLVLSIRSHIYMKKAGATDAILETTLNS
jgi:hypothetical protein